MHPTFPFAAIDSTIEMHYKYARTDTLCNKVQSGWCPFSWSHPFLYSEIRLMEIVEGLCESSSFECNRMVEEHEEQFEIWWFKRWVCWLNVNIFQVSMSVLMLAVAELDGSVCQRCTNI